MTVDLVDNREHFEDVYPSDSEGAEDSDGGVISDSETKSQAVKDLTTQLQQLEMATREATEQRNSAQGRLNMLDNYARSLITSRPEDIATCVTAYQNERAKAFEDHKTGEARMKEHDQQISKVKIKKRKLQLKLQKEQARANRAKTKEQERKHRIHQQNVSEKNRVRQERMRFWPKKVWKVVLSLETHANTTPTSSRRESIESMAKSLKPVTRNAPEGSDVDTSMIKLSFSYIVHSASWSPRYDLALDTRTKSGSITYRAEFRNTTSETWRDASVILSTSQTSFQGLGDSIPKIQPWHIRLAKGFGDVGNVDEALYSRHEHNPQHRSQGLFGQASHPRVVHYSERTIIAKEVSLEPNNRCRHRHQLPSTQVRVTVSLEALRKLHLPVSVVSVVEVILLNFQIQSVIVKAGAFLAVMQGAVRQMERFRYSPTLQHRHFSKLAYLWPTKTKPISTTTPLRPRRVHWRSKSLSGKSLV